MADLIFDFTEADDFEPVPGGVYQATIDATYAQDVRYGREKGTPYVTLGFDITYPEDYERRKVFNKYMLAGKGARITKRLLRSLGLYSDDDGKMIRLDPKVLHGIEVTIRVCEDTMKDGTPTNTVTDVMPVTT